MAKAIVIKKSVGPFTLESGAEVGPYDQLASLRVDAVLGLRVTFLTKGDSTTLQAVLLVADLDVPLSSESRGPLVVAGIRNPQNAQAIVDFLGKASKILADFADPTIATLEIDVTGLS